MDKRVRIMSSSIKGKTLDVGCNSGILHGYLSEKHEDLFGIDSVVTNYKDNVARGVGEYMPFKDEVFDSVVGGEIIEHLKNPEVFIGECFRILKSKGRIILTTPNKNSLINRIFKSYNTPFHLSLMVREELFNILEKSGFVIDTFNCLPYTNESSDGTRYKKSFLIRKLIHPLLPQALQEEMLVISKKE
jgi:2-polyprenyl-3-methyl-5-hydroxy-6-metoxy-1,4-benzoquinol methylase